ncbi:hypothetical protein D1872_287540 [compost metagenome]
MSEDKLKNIEYAYLIRKEFADISLNSFIQWEIDGVSHKRMEDVDLIQALHIAAEFGWELVCKEREGKYILKR